MPNIIELNYGGFMECGKTRVSGERFNLGRTVITRGALGYCEDNQVDYLELLMRHAVGDFGDVGKISSARLTVEELELGALVTSNDLKLNAVAIKTREGMVMSVYPTKGETKVWVQTMLAGSETYTTILLPSEY
jgi:hypothetical protein